MAVTVSREMEFDDQPAVENPWDRVLAKRAKRAVWLPPVLALIGLVFVTIRTMSRYTSLESTIARFALWTLLIMPLVSPWSALRLWRVIRRSPLLLEMLVTPTNWAEQMGALRRCFARFSAAVVIVLVLLAGLWIRLRLTEVAPQRWRLSDDGQAYEVFGDLSLGEIGFAPLIPFMAVILAIALWAGMLFHDTGLVAMVTISRSASALGELVRALLLTLLIYACMILGLVLVCMIEDKVCPRSTVWAGLFERRFFDRHLTARSPFAAGWPSCLFLLVTAVLYHAAVRRVWRAWTREVPVALLRQLSGEARRDSSM